MYNDGKIFTIWRNSDIIGVVRVLLPPISARRKTCGYLVVFIPKAYRNDPRIEDILYTEVSYVARLMKKREQLLYRLLLPFVPPMRELDYLTERRVVKEFGSTARMRGSSVLLDEQTGKPLF